jgi:hypothetical protein
VWYRASPRPYSRPPKPSASPSPQPSSSRQPRCSAKLRHLVLPQRDVFCRLNCSNPYRRFADIPVPARPRARQRQALASGMKGPVTRGTTVRQPGASRFSITTECQWLHSIMVRADSAGSRAARGPPPGACPGLLTPAWSGCRHPSASRAASIPPGRPCGWPRGRGHGDPAAPPLVASLPHGCPFLD